MRPRMGVAAVQEHRVRGGTDRGGYQVAHPVGLGATDTDQVQGDDYSPTLVGVFEHQRGCGERCKDAGCRRGPPHEANTIARHGWGDVNPGDAGEQARLGTALLGE